MTVSSFALCWLGFYMFVSGGSAVFALVCRLESIRSPRVHVFNAIGCLLVGVGGLWVLS